MKSVRTIKSIYKNSKLLSCKYDLGRKLTLQKNNDIWEMTNGIKFFLPHFPYDFISKNIVVFNDFFEADILKTLDKYIPQNAVIIDIGANIGNHSVYWAHRGAKTIHCFEPMIQTYNSLVKNIEINKLNDIVKTYNIGLGDKKTTGEIKKVDGNNIGATQIQESAVNYRFGIRIEKLDDIELNETAIDFVKIDVECFELKTLEGMKNTLIKYKPIIFIETVRKNYRHVKNFLKKLGYNNPIKYEFSNYLFFPQKQNLK